MFYVPRKKQDKNNTTDASADDSVTKQDDIDTNLPVYKTDETDLVDTDDTANNGRRPVHIHVSARKGESVEQMLRRFNYAVTKSDLINRLRDLQFYEKPSKKRQREEKLRMSQRRHYDD